MAANHGHQKAGRSGSAAARFRLMQVKATAARYRTICPRGKRFMLGRFHIIAVLFAMTGAIAALAQAGAQSCGQPPDLRYNTAGYASWCSCMDGSYNYQTTECVGAHGPSGGGYRRRSSGTWGCLAQSRNGA
jgi:hypothetical protein